MSNEGDLWLSCGHKATEYDGPGGHGHFVSWGSEECDAIDGFHRSVSYGSLCNKCLAAFAASGLILATEKEEDDWLAADPCLKEAPMNNGWSSDYYVLPEGATELQDLIEYRGMNFAVGNIFKAAYRLGQKKGVDREYDLRKIQWYAQRELARIEGDKE